MFRGVIVQAKRRLDKNTGARADEIFSAGDVLKATYYNERLYLFRIFRYDSEIITKNKPATFANIVLLNNVIP